MTDPSSTRVDMTLDVDEVSPEDLQKVWEVLTRVAEGLALDGHNVGVRLYQSGDDGEEHVLAGPVFDETKGWTP